MDKNYLNNKLEGLVNEYNTLIETGERLRNDLKNIEAQAMQKLGAAQEVQKMIEELNDKDNVNKKESKETPEE